MRPLVRRQRAVGLVLLAVILTAVLATPAGANAADAPSAGGATIRLLQADAQGVALELTTPDFLLASGKTGQTLDAKADCRLIQAAGMAQTAAAGQPQLPVKSVLLGAPPGATLQLDVAALAARTVATGVSLCAATAAPRADESGDEAAVEPAAEGALDTAVYNQNAFYPTDTVRVIDLGFMRSQRIVRVEFYPFQYNPVTGEVRASAQVRATVRFSGGAGTAVVEPQDWETSFKELLLNYASAANFRASDAPAVTDSPAAASSWTPPQGGYKIAVTDEGIYHLTRSALAAAGLPVDTLDPRTIRIYNAETEIALQVTGEADGKLDAVDEVIFYGRAVDNRYTNTNIYWLTYGGSNGARMGSRSSLAGGNPVASYLATVKKEDNSTYDSSLPRLSGYDHWFGPLFQAVGANKTGSTSVSLPTPQLAAGDGAASVKVMLGAITSKSHHIRVYVNPATYPAAVFEGTWDGIDTVYLASTDFPQHQLNAIGNNTIKVEVINDAADRVADALRLDWVSLGYARALVVDGDKLLFGGDTAGARQYSVSGFSTSNVRLYDITDPAQVVAITGATIAAGSIGPEALTLQFGDNQATPRRYAAWEASQLLTPLAITLDQPSNLQATGQGADYIILTHGDFAAAVQPLADLRAAQSAGLRSTYLPLVIRSGVAGALAASVPAAAQAATGGMRVKVIDVQDVYDEFGGGRMSAEAIRNFVAYAYANWAKPAPSYLLLVGDGTYDFRNYRSTAPTFIPPFLEMVDPDAGETATDNRYVAVTAGDILPDLHVGRLPANSAAEATVMVNKILAYENQAGRPWTKQVLFVADDREGGGGYFDELSDGVADGTALYKGNQVKVLPADYAPSKVYLGVTCDLANPVTSVECRAQIVDKINSGTLMVSYVGHGTKTYWAAEGLYDASSLNSLSNAGRLPIMLPMTCNEGYFIDPAEASLSEQGVRAENKGAIASWAPTGFGLAPGHDYLERGLFLAVFYDGKTLGSGATAAKLYLVANAPPGTYDDLIDTFLLLGDPALRVR